MFYYIKVLIVIDILMAIGLFAFRLALVPRLRAIVSPRLVVTALLIPAVGIFGGSVYIFFLFLAGAVVVAATSRNEAAGTYVFLLPLMPNLLLEQGAGSIYLFALSSGAALGLGALIAFFVGGGRRAVTQPRYDAAALAIVLLLTFMYNHDLSPTGLLRGLTVYTLGLGGPYLLVSRAIRDQAGLDRVLLRLSLGATLMATTAAFQGARHWVLFEIYYLRLHVPSPVASFSLSMRAGLLRTGGSLNDYSVSGLYLAAMVTLLPLLRRHFRPAAFWGLMTVQLAGLFATQSRGGWAAAIVGLVFVAAIRGKWGRVLLLAGGAGAAELAILLFVKSGRLADMLGRGQATGNVTYRQDLLTNGLEQIKAHPLFGQSITRLTANLESMRQGEGIVDFVNGHLFVAMTAGIPLFLLWCVIWSMPVVEGWRARRSERSEMAAVPGAIIVPAMTALTFTSIIDRNLTWPMLALALAAPCLKAARAASTTRRSGGSRAPARAMVAPGKGALVPA